jgi:hypothetical protein
MEHSLFSSYNLGLLGYKVSIEMDWQRRPYNLAILFPCPRTRFLVLGAHKECCLHSISTHHFAGTCWEDISCCGCSYTFHATLTEHMKTVGVGDGLDYVT